MTHKMHTKEIKTNTTNCRELSKILYKNARFKLRRCWFSS